MLALECLPVGRMKDLTLLEVNSQMSWIPGNAQALCLVPQIFIQPPFNARDKATPYKDGLFCGIG